jgi:hypothetical protein
MDVTGEGESGGPGSDETSAHSYIPLRHSRVIDIPFREFDMLQILQEFQSCVSQCQR